MNKRKKIEKSDSAKLSFWPTKYQVIGVSGCLLGTVGGPGVLYAGILLFDWLLPGTLHYSLFYLVAFLCSVPLGMVAGTAIGIVIAEKATHRKT